MSDELYLEGAKRAAAPEPGVFMISFAYPSGEAAPVVANSFAWSRLREEPFASSQEAWHWLHSNAEKLLRERVVAVRLLQVVERRLPQLIAMFHEATPQQIKDVCPEKAKGKKSSPYALPGDEWKDDA